MCDPKFITFINSSIDYFIEAELYTDTKSDRKSVQKRTTDGNLWFLAIFIHGFAKVLLQQR